MDNDEREGESERFTVETARQMFEFRGKTPSAATTITPTYASRTPSRWYTARMR